MGQRGVSGADLTTFVGRGKDLAEGRRLLGTSRLLTLVGPGGVGKTRLARRLADQVSRVFADGLSVVELAELDEPDALAATVAGALGLDDLARAPEIALAAHLERRHLLLVLDNCEHLVEACAAIVVDLLRQAPKLRVLATSRQLLGVPGEQLMTVAPLSLPSTEPGRGGVSDRTSEAVSLFVDRAQLVSPGFELTADNAATLGRLCTMLEGMPLAIELAAARLRVLSLEQMIDRFEDRFGLLSAGGAAGSPRHQTLRASIDWSFELCSDDEQAVWARMSVFEGGADLDAVEAVCGGPSLDVLEAVAGLVDKSVLAPQETAGRVRYRMLTSIRDYGRERLAERGETHELLVRHRDYYVALARKNGEAWFGPAQRGRLSRVSSEIGNFRAALEASLVEPADPDSALELVGSLWWYWVAVGAMDRGIRFNDRVLSVELPASSLAMQALSKAAMLASLGNDAARLERFAERVLAIELTRPDDGARSARRRVTGLLHAFRLDLEPAIREDLRALSEEAQVDRLGAETTVEVLVQLSTRLAWGHRASESLERVDAAIELCRRHGEEWYLSYLLYLRGARLRSLRRYEEALEAARECLVLARGFNSLAIVSSIETVAQVFAGLGQGKEAAVLYGALNGLWSGVGSSLYYGDEKAHTRGQQRARELLPADEFESAYDLGRAMTQDEVIAFVLGEQPVPVAATPPHDDLAGVDLTRRELEVAELIARGLSNKEIAESLVISPRTAEGHVTRLLQKLGFQSRALVATWVAERRVLRGA